jgi:hypothetical protein
LLEFWFPNTSALASQAKQQEITLIAAWLAKADLFGKQNSNKPLAVLAGILVMKTKKVM